MDTATAVTDYPVRGIDRVHVDSPQWHIAETAHSAAITVRCTISALAAAGRVTAIRPQFDHQSRHVSRDIHDTKPSQLNRCFDQTFDEHESPLRYLGSFVTSKYLMVLMLINSKHLLWCTDS